MCCFKTKIIFIFKVVYLMSVFDVKTIHFKKDGEMDVVGLLFVKNVDRYCHILLFTDVTCYILTDDPSTSETVCFSLFWQCKSVKWNLIIQIYRRTHY